MINFFSKVALLHRAIIVKGLQKYIKMGRTQYCRKYSAIATSLRITEHKIPISSANLAYYVAAKLWEDSSLNPPASTIPVICLHGFLDNAGSFDPLIPLILKPNHKILAIDLIGHGFSSHTVSPFYDQYMESFISIIRILEYFKWDKASFIGHSLGARILYTFASVYPKYVDRFVCLDNFSPSRLNVREYVSKNIWKYFDVDKKLSCVEPPNYTWDNIVERANKVRDKSVKHEGCKILLKRGARKLDNGRFQYTHDLRATIPTMVGRFSNDQITQFATELRCPICVIKAEPGIDYEPREDFMSHIEFVRKYAERVEFHLVPGTHHLHLNTPELVAPIITSFLES